MYPKASYAQKGRFTFCGAASLAKGRNMDNERIRHDRSARGIEKALKALAHNKPQFENIITAFGPMLLAKAIFKETHPLSEDLKAHSFPLDQNRFSAGEPLFATMGVVDFHEALPLAAEALLPVMKTALKGISRDLEKIEKAFSTDMINTHEWIQAFVIDDQDHLKREADLTGSSFEIFKFALGQLVKPFMEMQATMFAPLTHGIQWLHGYCPICGSHAAIAGLVGEGGKRWLQCAVCEHEWRFNRHTCPRCNDTDHSSHEYFFDENSPVRAQERVDVCNKCNSYLLTMDLRQRIDPVCMEVTSMGMVPLDILAQEKGYIPMAATPWNSLK